MKIAFSATTAVALLVTASSSFLAVVDAAGTGTCTFDGGSASTSTGFCAQSQENCNNVCVGTFTDDDSGGSTVASAIDLCTCNCANSCDASGFTTSCEFGQTGCTNTCQYAFQCNGGGTLTPENSNANPPNQAFGNADLCTCDCSSQCDASGYTTNCQFGQTGCTNTCQYAFGCNGGGTLTKTSNAAPSPTPPPVSTGGGGGGGSFDLCTCNCNDSCPSSGFTTSCEYGQTGCTSTCEWSYGCNGGGTLTSLGSVGNEGSTVVTGNGVSCSTGNVNSNGCSFASVSGECVLRVTHCNGVFNFASLSGNGIIVVDDSVTTVVGADVSGNGCLQTASDNPDVQIVSVSGNGKIQKGGSCGRRANSGAGSSYQNHHGMAVTLLLIIGFSIY